MIHAIVKTINTPPEFVVRYKNRVKILSISKSGECEWFYEVAIGGTLLLNANREKELVNVELMLPKQRWQRAEIISPFKPKTACRLFLPEIDQCRGLEDVPVFTFFDTSREILQVMIARIAEGEKCYRIADGFDAIMRGDQLIGFQLTTVRGDEYRENLLR